MACSMEIKKLEAKMVGFNGAVETWAVEYTQDTDSGDAVYEIMRLIQKCKLSEADINNLIQQLTELKNEK